MNIQRFNEKQRPIPVIQKRGSISNSPEVQSLFKSLQKTPLSPGEYVEVSLNGTKISRSKKPEHVVRIAIRSWLKAHKIPYEVLLRAIDGVPTIIVANPIEAAAA